MSRVLERKSAPITVAGALPGVTIDPSDPEGTFVAIVSVTGVPDDVGDVIVPGSYARTLAKRTPKGVFSHDLDRWTARTVAIEEWMPGDPRLPKTARGGKPWPVGAGALVVKGQFNLDTDEGRNTHANVKFFSEIGECEWSIGYGVPKGGSFHKGGLRYINDIDLFEYSPVLFGAAPLSTTLEVKSLIPGSTDTEQDAAPAEITHAGLAVQAADSGRVLMLQRAVTEDDPAAGRWEFPGGGLDDGEDALDGAVREFKEETGVDLPDGEHVGFWDSPNGIYRGHVYRIASESDVTINPPHGERAAINPDDPDGDLAEVSAWFDPADLPDMPSLREEVRDTDWDLFATETKGMATADGGTAEVTGLGDAQRLRPATRPDGQASMWDAEDDDEDDDEDLPTPPGVKANGGLDQNRGNAENLRRWYVSGEGAAKIRWGTPGDFNRCVKIAAKHMDPERAKGYCNLRHQDAVGAPPGQGHPGTKSGYDPSRERGAYAGHLGMKAMVIDRPSGEGRVTMSLPGTYEAMREALLVGLSEMLNPVVGDHDEPGLCHDGRRWNGVQIVATYPDHVLVQRYKWNDSTPDTVDSFQVDYSADGDDVVLGDPVPVRIEMRAAVEPITYGLGPEAALAEPVHEVAERLAALLALVAEQDEDEEGITSEGMVLSTKAGRVLSNANESRLRAAVEHLLSVLAAAGIDLGNQFTDKRDGVADPLADTSTTARPDDPMPSEGKALLSAEETAELLLARGRAVALTVGLLTDD